MFITEYYKKLFGEPSVSNFSMREDCIEDVPQVSPSENSILTTNFTVEEMFEALSQMEHDEG